MDPQLLVELQELHRVAQARLDAGMSPAEVNRRVREFRLESAGGATVLEHLGTPGLSSLGSVLEDQRRQDPQKPGLFGQVQAGARAAFDTLTFGFGDEIDAAGKAVDPFGGDVDFDDALKAARAQRQEDREVAGTAVGVGTGAGLLASVLLPGGAAKGAATLGRAALRGAGVGAAEGALFGAGTTEGGAGERLEGAAEGAVIGAATGGAVGGAVRAGRAVRGRKGAPSKVQGAVEEAAAASVDFAEEIGKDPGAAAARMARATRGQLNRLKSQFKSRADFERFRDAILTEQSSARIRGLLDKGLRRAGRELRPRSLLKRAAQGAGIGGAVKAFDFLTGE